MREQTLDLLNPTDVGVETVVSFHGLRALATVLSVADRPAAICRNEPFHWNGTELVICSIGPVSWPRFEAVPISVLLKAGDFQFRFDANASTDRVIGASPEYREQVVQYLGPDRGHHVADVVGRNGNTNRLFVEPRWGRRKLLAPPSR